MPYVKAISKNKKIVKENVVDKAPKGIVRGADYYKNGGNEV